MLKIGLTGGIGSGKSTVSRLLKDMGAYVFDADAEAKRILDETETVQGELIAEFGSDILDADGTVNRKKLARVAFQDEDHQSRLNAVIHPHVFSEIDAQFDTVSSEDKHTLFVVDAALIFESGLDQHLDYILTVTALLRHRMERVLKAGKLTRDEVLKRMDLQWPDEEKVKMSDFVVHNDSTEDELLNQLREVYHQLV